MVNILFINQTDILDNNSVGITIKALFGQEVMHTSMIIEIVHNKDASITLNGKRIAVIHNYFLHLLELIHYVKEYKADIIYTTGNSVKTLLLLLTIKHRLRVPILIHYYDNWRETGRTAIKNFLLKRIEDSKVGALVISKEMQQAYEKKYHNKYVVLMNSCTCYSDNDTKFYYEQQPISEKQHFVYAGGLHLNRYRKLIELGKEIAENHIDNVVIDIFTFSKDKELYAKEFIGLPCFFHDAVSHEEMQKIYRRATALLYVENVDENNLKYIKYSMSTKIPEYLTSGRPIVCFSCSGVASYSYFQREQTALIIDDKLSLQDVCSMLKEADPRIRDVVERGFKSLEKDFNSSHQQDVVIDMVREILGNR